MLEIAVAAALAGILAGVVTAAMVPFAAKVAFAVRAVDYPGGRKFHGSAVPRLGGVAIIAGAAFGAGAVALVRWAAWGGRVSKAEVLGLFIATAMVFTVGLVDDVVGVSVAKKLLVEFAAAVLIVYAGWWFSVLGLPGGGEVGAILHLARGVCRRAERRMVALSRETPLPPVLIAYINRLSDLLFTLARAVNREAGVEEIPW